MLRVRKLSGEVEREILARRSRSDVEAERAARKIVGDVRARGDRALFEWSAKFGARVTAADVWVTPAEMRAAERRVPRELLRAVDHAARNIRRVARMQKPRGWSVVVEPGVRVEQRVTAI